MSRSAAALVCLSGLLLAGCSAAPAAEPLIVASPSLPPGPDFPTAPFTVHTPLAGPPSPLAEQVDGYTARRKDGFPNGTVQLEYKADDFADQSWFYASVLPAKKSDAELGSVLKNSRRIGPSWCGDNPDSAPQPGVFTCITRIKDAVVFVESHDMPIEKAGALSAHLAEPLPKA